MTLRFGLGLGHIPARARPVPTTAPVNGILPSFPDPLTQGQTVAIDPGEWTGLPTGGFEYMRQRWNGSAWVDVGSFSSSQNVTFDASDVAAGAAHVRPKVRATNLAGSTIAYGVGVTIAAPLSISGTPGNPIVGFPYSFLPAFAGGHGPYSFALTGSLLAGLAFDDDTGEIYGETPSTGSASGLSIQVTDADGLVAVLGPFSLTASVGGGLPDEIESITITGDIMVPTSQAGIGEVHYPTNGILLELQAPGYAPITSIDPKKFRLRMLAKANGPNGTIIPNRERDIHGHEPVFKTSPDAGQYIDHEMRATGGARFSFDDQVFRPAADVADHNGVAGWGDRVDYLEIEAGAINGTSPYMLIPGNAVTREDSRPYAPIPYKSDREPIVPVTANGTATFGWVATDEHHRDNAMIACVEAWPETWDGLTQGAHVFANEVEESRWCVGGLSDTGAGLTYDEFPTTIDFTGMPHGKVGVRSIVYPHFGPAQTSMDLGDDFDTVAGQNLFKRHPVYHDLLGDRTPIYCKLSYDGTGITNGSSNTSGIYTTREACLAGLVYYADEVQALAAGRAWNNNSTNRPAVGGTPRTHNDPDNLHVLYEETAGAAGADAYSYSKRATATINCTYLPVTFESVSGLYSEAVRVRGVTHQGATVAAAAKIHATNKSRFVGLWFDGKNTEQTRSQSVSSKGCAMRLGNGTPSDQTPAGATPVNVGWAEFIDCYAESHSATSDDTVISESQFTIVRRGKSLNAPLRAGFTDHAGTAVTVGHWQDGDRGVLDGTWALGCKVTGGTVVMAQGNGVAARPLLATTKAFLQYNCLLLTRKGVKGALGSANHAFGRGEGLLGARRIGCVMGRFGVMNNTMFDVSSDNWLPGYKGDMTLGLSMMGKESDGTLNRVNWHYQDAAFEQIIKESYTRYSSISGQSMKESFFTQAGAALNSGSFSSTPYNNTTPYFSGQLLWDATTGGGTIQTGATVAQIKPRKASDGKPILVVPAGTAFGDPEYYLTPGYVAGTAVNGQARRNGNLKARQQVGCFGNVSTGDAVQLGADYGQGQELGNVAPPGLPTPALWGYCPSDTRYMNDTSGNGGDMNALDPRPHPLGPLMNLRPPGRCWDKRDMFGVLRDNDAWGPSGALEVGDVPFEIEGTPSTSGTTGQPYSFVPVAVGGEEPYAFALSGSRTGSGLSFDPDTGALTASSLGTVGTYGPFTITGEDDLGATDTIGPFSITITAVPTTVRASSGTVRASSNTVRASSG